jgi:hypothetical protein
MSKNTKNQKSEITYEVRYGNVKMAGGFKTTEAAEDYIELLGSSEWQVKVSPKN